MDDRQYDLLTPTERRVLRLVRHDSKSAVIASRAGMSRHTVDQHIKSARAKLGNVGRYVAADMLRAFEVAHPLPQGTETLGIVPQAPSEALLALPAAVVPTIVAEDLETFDPFPAVTGKVDHLDRWLEERSLLSRIVLVLAAALLLLLLVVSAPLMAAQMEKVGHLFYRM